MVNFFLKESIFIITVLNDYESILKKNAFKQMILVRRNHY